MRTPLTSEEVCTRLRSVIGTFSIRGIILFGSFARGTQTWNSDLDLIIIVDDNRRFLDRYGEILPMLHKLLRPHPVAPLIYNQQEFDRLRERPGGIVSTAEKEGIRIDAA